jgi:hypothetical protein
MQDLWNTESIFKQENTENNSVINAFDNATPEDDLKKPKHIVDFLNKALDLTTLC